MSTSTTLPLAEMSHAAKLRVMEELWDDLCHSSDGVPSPAWHGEVLAARAELVAKREAGVHEWTDGKERLPRKEAGESRNSTRRRASCKPGASFTKGRNPTGAS